VGYGHSVFLSDTHQLYGLGAVDFGQMGPHHHGNNISTPIHIPGPWERNNIYAKRVYAGYAFNVIITNNGETWVNGSNSSGQLGIKARIQTGEISQVPAFKNIKMRSAACGQMHVVYRTEDNNYYACGNFANTKIEEPILIININGYSLSNIVSVSCTRQTSIFLSSNGEVLSAVTMMNGNVTVNSLTSQLKDPSVRCSETMLLLFRREKIDMIAHNFFALYNQFANVANCVHAKFSDLIILMSK
jgi:alpha-tubulin suppressor-like RCC1 family protein